MCLFLRRDPALESTEDQPSAGIFAEGGNSFSATADTWMHYRIVESADTDDAMMLKSVRDWLSRDPEIQRDRHRLLKVCCAPELPTSLLGASRPIEIGACR